MSTPFADFALARRLETTEGHGNAAFIDAQARREPYSGAMRTTIAGTLAMFAGVGSPITQTFCLGIHERPRERDFDALERFFTSRGSAVFHEVCPHAGADLYTTLAGRGYKPIELSNVMYQAIDLNTTFTVNPQLSVRVVEKHEADWYGGVATRGWLPAPDASATGASTESPRPTPARTSSNLRCKRSA